MSWVCSDPPWWLMPTLTMLVAAFGCISKYAAPPFVPPFVCSYPSFFPIVAVFFVCLSETVPKCALTPSDPWIHAGKLTISALARDLHRSLKKTLPSRAMSKTSSFTAETARVIDAADRFRLFRWG